MLRIANRRARLLLYNPEPEGGLQVRLAAHSFQQARHVRLLEGTTELARWDVTPDAFQTLESPILRLSHGLHDLTLESDRDAHPKTMLGAAQLALAAFYVKSAILEDDRVKEVTHCVAVSDGDVNRVSATVVPIDGKDITMEFEI